MSKRTHMGLRLMGLLVLLAVAIWPKARSATQLGAHDRGVLHVATKAQAPTQLMIDRGERSAIVRAGATAAREDDANLPVSEPVVGLADVALTN